jgi:hypothetical protein
VVSLEVIFNFVFYPFLKDYDTAAELCTILTCIFYLISAYPYKSYQVGKYNKLGIELNSKQHIADSLRKFELVKEEPKETLQTTFILTALKMLVHPRFGKCCIK